MTPGAAGKELTEVWDAHVAAEFTTRDADAAVATMTEDATLIHVPVGTGARGRGALRVFYARYFIPAWPDDVAVESVSRTVGADSVVDELLIRCTHSQVMDFWLPGVAPTGRPIVMPTVAIVGFAADKIAFERIYWDQASLLAQLGLLDTAALPVLGSEEGQLLSDGDAALNGLITRLG